MLRHADEIGGGFGFIPRNVDADFLHACTTTGFNFLFAEPALCAAKRSGKSR
jgi:hypothetical protein